MDAPSFLFDLFVTAQVSFTDEDESGFIVHKHLRHPSMKTEEENYSSIKSILEISLHDPQIGSSAVPIAQDVVLTDETGKKKYGTCIYVPNFLLVDSVMAQSLDMADLENLDEGICTVFYLFSSYQNYSITRKCLAELVTRSQIGSDVGLIEKYIWWLLHNVVVPPTCSVGIKFHLPTIDQSIEIEPSFGPAFPFKEVSLIPIFQSFGIGNIMMVHFILFYFIFMISSYLRIIQEI